jgi:hypothetical protein
MSDGGGIVIIGSGRHRVLVIDWRAFVTDDVSRRTRLQLIREKSRLKCQQLSHERKVGRHNLTFIFHKFVRFFHAQTTRCHHVSHANRS